jgi:hypothetical protein
MSKATKLLDRMISQDEVDMIFGWELIRKLPKKTTLRTDKLFDIPALKPCVEQLGVNIKHTNETVIIIDLALHLPYPSLFGMVDGVGFSLSPKLATKLLSNETGLNLSQDKPLNFTDIEINLLSHCFKSLQISQNFSIMGDLWSHEAVEITCYNEALTLYKPVTPPDYPVILSETDVEFDALTLGSIITFDLTNRSDVHFKNEQASLKYDENGAYLQRKTR